MQQPENSTIAYRLNALEQNVISLKQQLDHYVPVRENELQLKSIRDTVERIERDVGEAKKQLGEVNTKIVVQQESQSALQIKVLWGIVSIIITILAGALIGYITHLFR